MHSNALCGNELILVHLDTEHDNKHKVALLCGCYHISDWFLRQQMFNRKPALQIESMEFER